MQASGQRRYLFHDALELLNPEMVVFVLVAFPRVVRQVVEDVGHVGPGDGDLHGVGGSRGGAARDDARREAGAAALADGEGDVGQGLEER